LKVISLFWTSSSFFPILVLLRPSHMFMLQNRIFPHFRDPSRLVLHFDWYSKISFGILSELILSTCSVQSVLYLRSDDLTTVIVRSTTGIWYHIVWQKFTWLMLVNFYQTSYHHIECCSWGKKFWWYSLLLQIPYFHMLRIIDWLLFSCYSMTSGQAIFLLFTGTFYR
jgi:hypothetical protein